jgi:peptide/nickel transport system permease protein
MIAFLVRRLLQAVAVLFIVTIMVFILIHRLPGGPARAELGVQATPTAIASFNQQHGFDKSLWTQYWTWLSELLRGDLGYSFKENSTVSALLLDRLPKTALLAGVSVLVAVLLAIPLGVVQALRRNTIVDYVFTAVTFVLYSTPSFWLSLILVLVFSVNLGWVPAQAPQGSIGAVLSQPSGLVLPVATIALISVALYSRYMRSSTIDNLTQDYVRTVLRNAISPVLTLLGLSLPFILSGTLITERVFNYPGMGLLFYNAAVTQDYPVLLAVTLIVAVATVAGSVFADICYALLDPRVRYAHA